MRDHTHRPDLHLPLTIRPRPELLWYVIVLMVVIGLFMVVFGGMFLQLGPGDDRRYAGLLYVILCAGIIALAPATLRERLVLTEDGITHSGPLGGSRTVLWRTIERAEGRLVQHGAWGGAVHEISLYGSNASDPVCLRFVDSPFRRQDLMVLRSLVTDRAPQAKLDRWFGYGRRQ